MLNEPTKYKIPYKTLLSLFFLICLNGQSLFAGNYPFPQNFTYPYGIKATNSNSATIQSKYNAWKAAMVTSSGCPAGMLRVQRINDGNDSVSEGISYGMLIAVYMDDQTTFNGLWKYKEYYNDANYLMNWQIASGGGVAGYNSAADADEDICTSLIMADKQWGSGGTFNYLALATAEIQKLKDHLVAGDNSLKPGDSWDAQEFAAYYMPAWYKLYGQVSGDTTTWNNVTSMCNSHMQTARNDSYGLVPRNINNDGSRGGNNYDYDSCRVPWRYANDFVWNGTVFSEGQCTRMASFFSPQGAGNIGDDYAVDTGNKNSNNHNAAFTGPAGCSLMVGPASTYQTSLNSFYSTVEGMNPATTYYAGCIQIITLLLMSGNMPDFRNMFTPTNTPTINLSWTKTRTPTITPTWTASPIPPPTNKLNLEVMSQGSSENCTTQTFGFQYKITNWENAVVNTSNMAIKIWVDTTDTIAGSIYNARKYDSADLDLGTITVAITEGAGVGCGGATKSVLLTVTSTDIPANGGYLMIQGSFNRGGYQTPFDAGCNDYTKMLSTWTTYQNNTTQTLYQGTNLVCEYTSASTQDASTGKDPCTGGNGCSPAVSPSNSPTKTRSATATASMSPSNTYTRTRTPASTNTYTRTATRTNTIVVPSATYTRTALPTGTFTFTRTSTYTRTPLPTATNTPVSTSTFTRTMTDTPNPSSTFTRTNTATGTPTLTLTLTNSLTGTPTRTANATFTDTGTRTPTGTNTQQATATYSASATASMSPINTYTRTWTASVSPTITNTKTPTGTTQPTATMTNTSTPLPSPSNSPTATRTGTASYTRTETGTYTVTASSTSTWTATQSYTETATKTSTRTPSFTRTATETFTMTATRTYTRTATPTGTVTSTGTISPTHSVSPTITETITGTPPTNTVTPTITETHTDTPVDTVTETGTQTVTDTVTETETPSETVTLTETLIPTGTFTDVPTGTETPVDTALPSATNTVNIPPSATDTPVIPDTATNTPVIPPTATVTRTSTPLNTATLTLTLTATRSATASVSPLATFTRTPTTLPATYTFTPTPAIQTGKQEITNLMPFPNPFNPSVLAFLYIDFTAARNDSDGIRLSIYTSSMRLIRKVEFKDTDARNILLSSRFRCDSARLLGLANGAYYYVITAEKAGEKAHSKVGKVVILK